MKNDEEELISGLDVEGALPEALVKAFSQRSKRVNARKGQMLISQGGDADEVFLILSGKIHISIFSVNGRETILREMGPGRLLGEMAAMSDMPRSACAIVVEDASLSCVPGHAFREFLQNVPGAGYWMATQLAARVRNLTEKSAELASLPVGARLQSEILRLSINGNQRDDRCEINNLPTHIELAARIGTHREAITRELRLLAQEGLAIQSGRKLVIPSLTRLKALLERLSR